MHLNLPKHQVPREFLQNVSSWAMGQKRVSEEPTTYFTSTNQELGRKVKEGTYQSTFYVPGTM